MKNKSSFLAAIILFFLSTNTANSQVTVVSTTGYSVTITITPKSIVTSGNSCQWGYNYNVKLDYKVTFSGSNVPASLYTLQGTLGCGSSSHFFDLPNNGGTGTVVSQSNVWNSHSDCGTANVTSLVCSNASVQINGPGISNRTVNFTASLASASSIGTLPVKLVDFSAEAANDKVVLTWATATEENNSFFSVERSDDGSTWTVVKTIQGAGNSSVLRKYECADNNPTSGTVYYRLKQTDFDGNSSYSNTRSIVFANTTRKIYLFPVPSTGNSVNFGGIADSKNFTLVIRNAAGISIYNAQLVSTTIQLPSIKRGLYFVELTNKETGERTNLQYVKI